MAFTIGGVKLEKEMSEMKKLTLTVFGLATVLLMFSMPTLAGPPSEAGGLWQYQPFDKVYDADGECVPPTGAPEEEQGGFLYQKR